MVLHGSSVCTMALFAGDVWRKEAMKRLGLTQSGYAWEAPTGKRPFRVNHPLGFQETFD
jgi:hypothetical protein